MLLGIDHLVIAVADPEEAAALLEDELGLAATGGGRHDALGTYNRLIWLGDTYFELIGVFDRELAENAWIGQPTIRALDAGGGLVTWSIATDALDIDLARLRAIGSGLGEPIAGERRRPDGAVARWRLVAPRSLGQSEAPFLIEHDTTSAEWTRAERTARAEVPHPIGGPVSLEALELPVDDVNRTMLRFLRTIGLRFRPSLAGGGSRDADVGPHIVRLRPRRSGSGSASAVIRLRAPVAQERVAELLDCLWILRPG